MAAVQATDLDSGMNAQIRYNIQKGALDAFSIHQDTGVVSVAGGLDYDRKNTYHVLITATDMGTTWGSRGFRRIILHYSYVHYSRGL